MSNSLFHRKDVTQVEKVKPTVADFYGIKPPTATPEQRAGAAAAGVLAANQMVDKIARMETFKKEREDFQREREDAIWKRVEARQRAAV